MLQAGVISPPDSTVPLSTASHAQTLVDIPRLTAQIAPARGQGVLIRVKEAIIVAPNDHLDKEEAVATLSVYDRRGRRLGTVYLGEMPEPHQRTLSNRLTRLIEQVLSDWDGVWPRLAYVTDAGHHPTEYYREVLRKMGDPRRPGKCLNWIWIVDFYHASE